MCVNVYETDLFLFLFPHAFNVPYNNSAFTNTHALYNPGHSIYPDRGSLRFRPVLNGLASIASLLRVIEGGQSPNDVLRAH